MDSNRLAIFMGKEIRKTIYQNEWWFSVIDVCGALTDSVDAGAYWRKLKERLNVEGNQIVTFCHGLKLTAVDGSREKLIAPTPKEFLGSFNLFLRQKQSRLNVGWRKLAMRGCKKLKIRNWLQRGLGLYIKPKDIARTGSRRECVALPFAKN